MVKRVNTVLEGSPLVMKRRSHLTRRIRPVSVVRCEYSLVELLRAIDNGLIHFTSFVMKEKD